MFVEPKIGHQQKQMKAGAQKTSQAKTLFRFSLIEQKRNRLQGVVLARFLSTLDSICFLMSPESFGYFGGPK